jgi:hypothetical protein
VTRTGALAPITSFSATRARCSEFWPPYAVPINRLQVATSADRPDPQPLLRKLRPSGYETRRSRSAEIGLSKPFPSVLDHAGSAQVGTKWVQISRQF